MKIFSSPKKIMLTSTVFAATLVTAFLYTNMKNSNQDVPLLIQESKNIQNQIEDPNFSPASRSFLIAHKKFVLNVLSNKLLAESCAELHSYDNSMPTGKYIFYKKGQAKNPEMYSCTVSQKKLTKQTFVKALTLQTNSQKNNLTAYKNVTLNKGGTALQRADIPGTRGLPTILKLLSSKPCKANTDYGFDANGIWVKNGCQAKFKVPITVPVKDRTIASGKPNANPFLGSFTFESDKTKMTIKGWACESKKVTPVKVQIYAGGPAGIGKLLTTSTAENTSESAVNEKCNTNSAVGHRFIASLSLQSLSKHKGKELFAYGLGSDVSGTVNSELNTSLRKTFPGSNQCGTTTCSMEDPRDKKDGNRFMIRNDANSVKQRCEELGYTHGTVLDTYTKAEWCGYSNARTKYWNGSKWILGSCVDGNVSSVRCYQGIP